MFGLVCDVRTKISSNYTMPSGIILLVELLLNVGSNIFLNVEFLQGDICTINGVLLHLLVHIGMLNDSFPFGSRHCRIQINIQLLIKINSIYIEISYIETEFIIVQTMIIYKLMSQLIVLVYFPIYLNHRKLVYIDLYQTSY